MNILVTGSAGFIGFHLIERLIKDGNTVVGVDSINDYYDVNLKYGRLKVSGIDKKDISYNKQVESIVHNKYCFYQLRLEDYEALDQLFAKHTFDCVINLAAQAGVRYSVSNPHAYVDSNISGFLNILECCKNHSIKHLVYASSSSVYGMNTEEVFSVNDNVDHPVSIYAATKRSNELMAHVYSSMYNLPVTGLRFFTVYGPWGRPDMALFLFTKAILEDEPINVYNYGNMLRDFTYIDDIVEGVARIVPSPPKNDKNGFNKQYPPSSSYAPFKIFNIGNSAPVKLTDFIEVIEKETGKKAKKNLMPLQPGDVYKTFADVTPLMKELGYAPSTSIEDGVRKFIKWYYEFYKPKNKLL